MHVWHTHMHVCVHGFMYACIHEWVHVSMHACMYGCTHACMYVSMYVCLYVCMRVCLYVEGWGWRESPPSAWLQQRWRQAVANLAPATRQVRADTAHYTRYSCTLPRPHQATPLQGFARTLALIPLSFFKLINGKLNLPNWKMGGGVTLAK